MKSLWSDREAAALVEQLAGRGVGRDLALRVYTTRLLGSEPRLVLHGGGNTSVKTAARDLLGHEVPVLHVKGSGWDMGTIEPEGLPAVRLEPLREFVKLESLSDEEMVNAQRTNLLDASAPNPSVETLLHAFLPHKFVDHSHANAVLSLTDQPDGEEICREVYGDRAILLPYIMPGFPLAKAVHAAYQAQPDVEGIVLLKHGIFTFGETAAEAYERMIELVSLAEGRIGRGPRPLPRAAPPGAPPAPAVLAPILRGLCAVPGARPHEPRQRFVVEFRNGERVLDYVNGRELDRYSQAGTVTPDHVIRTKPKPLLLPSPPAAEPDALRAQVRAALEAFAADYHAYFERNNAQAAVKKKELDLSPRVVLVPGVGLFALGKNAKAARVAADVAESAILTIRDAEAIGRFESITEAELFEMEYWSLEQAKLGKSKAPAFTGWIVAVTGGAGTIGRATAAAFRKKGAEVVLLDKDAGPVEAAAAEVGGLGLACDVTDPDAVERAFGRICEGLGGVDVVVSNAGAAWQGRMGEVADEVLRRSFELNFFAHQNVAKAAVGVMTAQGTGGCLLFNVSKQALNPGPGFGPYGLPKASLLALVRQYAIEYGADGIRSNAVNADRIQSGLLTPEMVKDRAAARGLSEEDYLAGNLLRRPVTARDVAWAFCDLARSRATTAAVLTVDGGNIAAAVR